MTRNAPYEIDRCNCPQYIGKLPLKHNEILCGNVLVMIQSCDCEYANIGIFRDQRYTYHHVDVPSLRRQWKPTSFSPTDLGPAIFDAVMTEYRDEVMALIYRLNNQHNVQPSLPMEY